MDSELTSLCQSVLEDFNLCMFYLPSSVSLSSASEDEEEYEGSYSFLPDLLVFRMVVICLMCVHSLKRAGEIVSPGLGGGTSRLQRSLVGEGGYINVTSGFILVYDKRSNLVWSIGGYSLPRPFNPLD